jgi:autotransporter strand-loop-strand O-heptosyltransferase
LSLYQITSKIHYPGITVAIQSGLRKFLEMTDRAAVSDEQPGDPAGQIPSPFAPSFKCNFINGSYLEIQGDSPNRYRVEFQDLDEPEYVLQCEVPAGGWVRSPQSYFVRWAIEVFELSGNKPVFQHRYDCREKRVYIGFESSSLGDTLAWFPAVEQFREQHGCRLICSTFLNGLFKDNYPEIEFIEPGAIVEDLYAAYRIGVFYREDGSYDYSKNYSAFREHSIARAAYDILGLPYAETKPRVKLKDLPLPMDKPYVCIGFHSTSQAKYWNNPKGWDEVVRFLHYKGYKVVLLSREGKEYMGNRIPQGIKLLPEITLDIMVNYLQHASMFIGIGSGLSWLSWAVGCRTCLISGFSYPYTEMQDCIRVFPRADICSGCFNRFRLDPNDWNWCPDHKGTPRMFECSRLISGRQVIEAIRPFL